MYIRERSCFQSSEKQQWCVAENFSRFFHQTTPTFIKLTCNVLHELPVKTSPFTDIRAEISEHLPDFSKHCFCHFYAFLYNFFLWVSDSIFSGLFPSYDEKYLRPLKYKEKQRFILKYNIRRPFSVMFFKVTLEPSSFAQSWQCVCGARVIFFCFFFNRVLSPKVFHLQEYVHCLLCWKSTE